MFRKYLIAQIMQGKTFIRLKTTRSGAYGGIACIVPMIQVFPICMEVITLKQGVMSTH